jgi:succinoglycan biosynthesis protein ExoM
VVLESAPPSWRPGLIPANTRIVAMANPSQFSRELMTTKSKHICVCVCTYKRPKFLKRLFSKLDTQETGGLFTYSIVVADNDVLRSGEPVVLDFSAASAIRVKYCVQPQQNIALTRNMAVENASGDFVAFIDDDEFPEKNWLLTLFKTCEEYNVDGVLGPVKCYFDEQPPKWIMKTNFYVRPINPTGSVVDWREARTGNVLVRKRVIPLGEQPFRSEFLSGEDQDFFRRMIEKGHTFIWSADAVAYEVVPPTRWKRTYMLRKALLWGATEQLQPTCGPVSIAKSVIAVPGYVVALPLALLLGHHRFMALLVKLCHHLGKLLAVVGINPIKEPYVTE